VKPLSETAQRKLKSPNVSAVENYDNSALLDAALQDWNQLLTSLRQVDSVLTSLVLSQN